MATLNFGADPCRSGHESLIGHGIGPCVRHFAYRSSPNHSRSYRPNLPILPSSIDARKSHLLTLLLNQLFALSDVNYSARLTVQRYPVNFGLIISADGQIRNAVLFFILSSAFPLLKPPTSSVALCCTERSECHKVTGCIDNLNFRKHHVSDLYLLLQFCVSGRSNASSLRTRRPGTYLQSAEVWHMMCWLT
jgi:hypothetical protein